jgi:hypothetical protein
MPIHITVAVNENAVTDIHIGRMEKFKGQNQTHRYTVVEETAEPWEIDWMGARVRAEFEHTYGDGLLVCIEKGLAALNERKD